MTAVDSDIAANNTYNLTITVGDAAFNGDGSIPANAHTRDVDIQVTVLGVPDIESTTFLLMRRRKQWFPVSC